MKKKNELKIWIVAMVFMALLVLVFPLSVSGQVEASGLSFGTQVGDYNGVIAYSNYENDYVSNEYNYEDEYNTGMKWQCVEYVNRYYYIICGMEIRIPGTNAEDYYDTASDRGLVAYPNGGTTPPQPGDILCSNGGTLGHVAIVREVTADSVHVIHQNWANTEADNDKTISMSVSDRHYTISGFSGSYPVQGWLRTPTEVIYVPDDYLKIQWAVDNASEGDTIIVRDGTYVENINVNKRLTITSENGSANCIVQAANSDDHVFEVKADYVNIHGFMVKGATGSAKAGIRLFGANHCNISNNNLSNNFWGISLYWHSSNNMLSNNNVSNEEDMGIYLWASNNNILMDNIANLNDQSVFLYYSSNNTLSNNKVSNNKNNGIYIMFSNNNTLINNLANSNSATGIIVQHSNNNTLANNIGLNNQFGIRLDNSSNNTLTNNNANLNSYRGICLECSNSNTLSNNDANSNNYAGILLYHSSTNILINNNVSNNHYDGIELWNSSNNNLICLNNFINNTDNVYSSDSTNIWNSTSKITYTYNSSIYTNYLGNYWDDYTDLDTNNDGIWDNPRGIDSDWDYHPLVEPFENYPAHAENVFDTGAPANPYPSIMGNHTGTIKPNHTVIATKMYTYSCIGTGGHTEYARIWNSTWNATATWEGYVGDWHNISFDKTVVLLAGETYNYTIHTGSYPQIIHESPFNATGGTITCDKFVDANGRIYYDWIPAIKLFL